jgi:hypothetical protein
MTSKETLCHINEKYEWLPQVQDSTKLAIKRFADKNFITDDEVHDISHCTGLRIALKLLHVHGHSLLGTEKTRILV